MNKSLSKVFMIFLCCLMVACPGCAPAASKLTPTAETPLPIKLCYSSQVPTQAVIWYAYEKGLFRKYNLDASLVYISTGNLAASALIAKQVDVCTVAGSSIVSASLGGQDTVIMSGVHNEYLYSLYVSKDIRAAADLKGKALAVSKLGSSSDAALRIALRSLGLDPLNDVTIIAAGEDPQRLAAMDSGQVVGTLLTVPNTTVAKAKGYHELLDLSTLKVSYARTVIATTRTFLSENHETAVRFMKAILESIARMKQDPNGTKEVIAKYLTLDTTQNADLLQEAYTVLIQNHLDAVPYPSLDGIQTVLEELKNDNPKAAEAKPDQFVDTSILQELDKSGFVSGLSK